MTEVRAALQESIARRLFGRELPHLEVGPPEWRAAVEVLPIATEFPELFRDSEAERETSSAEYASDNEEAAVRGIRSVGFEFLAFYAPVSAHGLAWGIYFNESALWGLAKRCASELPGSDLLDVAADLVRSVDQHEQFHAAVEMLALVRDEHRFWPLAADPAGNGVYLKPADTCYRKYHSSVYSALWPTAACFEESLATAYQFSSYSSRATAILENLAEFSSPPAYAQWRRFSDAATFEDAYHTLASTVLSTQDAWTVDIGTARLLSEPPPSSWLPSLTTNLFDAVPRRLWRSDRGAPSLFLQGVFGNLRTSKLVGCLCSRYGAVVRPGGRHPSVVFPGGAKVAYSSSWQTVPPFFVRQVAAAAQVDKAQILATCG